MQDTIIIFKNHFFLKRTYLVSKPVRKLASYQSFDGLKYCREQTYLCVLQIDYP